MFIDSMGISPPFIWPELWYVYVKLYPILGSWRSPIDHSCSLMFMKSIPQFTSSTSCTTARLTELLHLAIRKGSDAHRQGVLQLIRMKGADAEPNYFLMDHISTNESRSVYPLEN
jgi:hypothetical protein